jgi:hypothetical protein
MGGNLGGTGKGLNILVMSSSGNGGSSLAALAWFSSAYLKHSIVEIVIHIQ